MYFSMYGRLYNVTSMTYAYWYHVALLSVQLCVGLVLYVYVCIAVYCRVLRSVPQWSLIRMYVCTVHE